MYENFCADYFWFSVKFLTHWIFKIVFPLIKLVKVLFSTLTAFYSFF